MNNDPAEAILRKIVTDPDDGYQHYVEIEAGVIDVRVDFTEEEIAYLRGLGAT